MTNAIMDFVLMGLLIAALWFGVRLDAKLKALRAAHEGFARAVGELDSAAIRAHASLQELRGHADDSQELLHGRILAARDVLQKLDAQVARAERVGNELDRGLTSYEAARTMPPPRAPLPRVEAPRVEVPIIVRAPVDTPVARRPFDRDVVRDNTPAPRNDDGRPTGTGQRARSAYTRLPEVEPEDEGDMLDKVQMSELVVANLNEMIRTLTLPSRQPEPRIRSVEDDLFGSEDFSKKR